MRLLRYELDGGYPVWKSFVTTFFSKELVEQIKSPIFQSEKEHIDISVKENVKYAFIFENKLKNAPFQRNQLGRYIMTLNNRFEIKDIYLVILPGYIDADFLSQIRPSVWKAPCDWSKSNDERKCIDSESEDKHACLCDSGQIFEDEWCSKKCKDFKERYKDLKDNIRVIDYEFTDWLLKVADEIIPSWEIYMKSAIVQFAHYIKGLYNIRLNTLEVMESIEILQKELKFEQQDWGANLNTVEKAINDLSSLEQSLKYLAIICKLRIWQSQVEKEHSDLDIEADNEGFWFRVNGVQCGVWFDNDKKKYYWGFYDDKKAIVSKQAESIINAIIEKEELKDVESNSVYIAWKYTENGATVINGLITAAKGIEGCVLSKKQ